MTRAGDTDSNVDAPRSSQPANVLVAYLDIYKHHFELWLKSYLVYLAILGTAAGFLFAKDQTPEVRVFLVVFIVVVSITAAIAFSIGLHWLIGFERILHNVMENAGAPRVGIYPFKGAVLLGIVASFAFVAAALYLYWFARIVS